MYCVHCVLCVKLCVCNYSARMRQVSGAVCCVYRLYCVCVVYCVLTCVYCVLNCVKMGQVKKSSWGCVLCIICVCCVLCVKLCIVCC